MSENMRLAAEPAIRRMRSVDLSYFPAYPGGTEKFHDDCQTIAALYLAEHPADEDEAVTEEWLRSVGFSIVKNFNGWYADIDIDGVNEPAPDHTKWRTWLRLHSPNHDGECVSDVFSEDDAEVQCGIGLTKSWPKTRGDVRRLCRAIGITLGDVTPLLRKGKQT